jgi:hypothetical protein
LYTLEYLERRRNQQLNDARLRLQRRANLMGLDRFDDPVKLQARKDAETYANLKIFEPYPDYDPALAYAPNQIVWWMNASYTPIKNVGPGITPDSAEYWEIFGSQRGIYRDQTIQETMDRKEYLRVQNELLGPSWRDAYLHKKDQSEAESAHLQRFALVDQPRELLAFRNARIPRIQAKSVSSGVSPGLLIDDTDI